MECCLTMANHGPRHESSFFSVLTVINTTTCQGKRFSKMCHVMFSNLMFGTNDKESNYRNNEDCKLEQASDKEDSVCIKCTAKKQTNQKSPLSHMPSSKSCSYEETNEFNTTKRRNRSHIEWNSFFFCYGLTDLCAIIIYCGGISQHFVSGFYAISMNVGRQF